MAGRKASRIVRSVWGGQACFALLAGWGRGILGEVMIKLMMTFCSVHDAVDALCRCRQPGSLDVEIITVVCCCSRKQCSVVMFGGIILGGKTGEFWMDLLL